MKLLYILSSIVFLGALNGCYAGASGSYNGVFGGPPPLVRSRRLGIDESSLINAARSANYDELEHLLQSSNADLRRALLPALMVAIEGNHGEVVSILLRKAREWGVLLQ